MNFHSACHQIHEELAALPPNPHLTDEDIDELFDLQTAAEVVKNTSDLHASRNLREFRSKFGKSPLEALVSHETENPSHRVLAC